MCVLHVFLYTCSKAQVYMCEKERVHVCEHGYGNHKWMVESFSIVLFLIH